MRRKGGGRRHLSFGDGTLIEDLRRIVEPVTLGCPVRPLLWVSKSHDKLAVALQKMGHKISANSVRRLLPTLGYSRQSNRKADEGSKHPDRERPIRAHQYQGGCGAGCGPARHLRRHEEERVDRQLPERRHGLSAQGRSAAREGARLRGQGTRQDRALWRVRRDGQCGLGQRRDHERYGRVRRRLDPPLARRDGA